MCNIFIRLFVVIILSSCNQNNSYPTSILKSSDKQPDIPKYSPANKELFDTIVALDKLYWHAYNEGDVNTIIDFMTEDHEFYHDEAGATFTKTRNADEWKRFFKSDQRVFGETLEGTNEIHEIPGYGALQLSYQRFHKQNDTTWTKPTRAIVLWQKTSKGWLQSRVFSIH